MSVSVRFLSLMALCLMHGLPAHAEGPLVVRTGDHDTYSRIVFEWKKLEGYQVEKPDNQSIVIKFSEAAVPPEGTVEAFNILGFEVISQSPFSARLKIPPGAGSRSFAAGNRVIVDVYDVAGRDHPKPEPEPPGGHGEKKESPPAEAKKPSDEPELGKIVKPDTHPVKPRPPEKKPEEEKKAEDEAVSAPAPPPAASLTQPAPAKEQPALVPKSNLITVSSTQSVGMAAFESGGQILMALDVPGVLVKPQVSGQNASLIEPVASFPVDKGLGFKAAALAGTALRGEGGGLLWSVVVTPDMKGLENAAIERREGVLFVPLKNTRGLLTFPDPQTGAVLQVVTVSDAESRVGNGRSFVDFDILPSAIGLAVRPKADGVEVRIVPEGVEITKPGGLVMSAAEAIAQAEEAEKKRIAETEKARAPPPEESGQVLFDFKEWRMGGLETLNQNRNIMFTQIRDKPQDEQIADLVQLARMHIANGRGAEALGFLRFASQEMPELEQNPGFLALRAVSKAFDGKLETALRDLSSPILADYDEAKIWKAYVLAGLGDWAQAVETLPDNLSILKNYTPEILNRLSLVLAEIELRDGNIEMAGELFKLVEQDKAEDDLNKSIDAQLQYLKGEAARQQGRVDETIKLWERLAKGRDDLYRVKAGLALTRLLIDEKKLTPKEAIDRLERLRYAWRGDELEAQVNYWLGRTYFEAGETIKGLKILRDAIPIARDTPLAPKVAADMIALYTGYFTSPELAKENPVDAAALYEEFKELLPVGEEGNKVMKALAERLVAADMLGRGAGLLQYQLDHRLKGDEAVRTAVRLAAIYLLDKDPEKALRSLEKAGTTLKSLPAEIATEERFREIELLRARALSQAKRPDQALSVLAAMKQGPDVNRLRADIAWQAGYWDDASYALQDVIDDEDIKLTRPLTDAQATILLQRALALNLSGDRIGLANMREKYTEAMAQTSKAKQFEVVTRARQSAGLADRQTLMSAVSEVDLFKGFLESYKKEVPPSN